MSATLETAQRSRLDRSRGGHYESWFLRANHPEEPRAFWIRYTLFIPANGALSRIGEVWAIYFDGSSRHPRAAQEDIPWSKCHVSSGELDLRIGESSLLSGSAQGQAQGSHHNLQWQLQYQGGNEPLLLLPSPWYERSFPKAKALVSRPLARFSGHLLVDGERVDISDWVGSENHNWGERHTDSYAWGQVCGFDNDGSSFLECASARVKLGPLWSPIMTFAVLRHEGRTLEFNNVRWSWRQKAKYAPGNWTFTCAQDGNRLQVRISAREQDIIALRYRNPPGGIKTCLNSKLAHCEVRLQCRDQHPIELHSANSAAFEILTDLPPVNGLFAN